MHDIDRINSFRPMYDSTLPLAVQVGEMRLGGGSETNSGSARVTNGDHGEKREVGLKRRFPEEEDEDILRETNDRFVLFPIKYHEVNRFTSS